MQIEAPFRQRKLKGIIIDIHNRTPEYQTREIINLKENKIILQKWQIELSRWISDYYKCELYKILRLFLPPNFPDSETKLKYELYISPNLEIKTDKTLNRAKKQLEILEYLKENGNITLEDLVEQKKYSKSTINTLIKKNLLKITQKKLLNPLRLKTTEILNQEIPDKKLTAEQEKTINTILESKDKYFLLHGITGSGKTEVYLRLARKFIQEKKQVLILVPEIVLTPQLINYFFNEFKNDLAIIHSRLNLSEKNQEYHRILNKEARLIIGSRSSLFSPFQNLGLIILDEEHEWTYKQENVPRYHSRKVALKISRLTGCKVLLSSATPSIESYYHGKTDKYKLLKMDNRISNNKLPTTYIVDLKQELKKRNYSIFSDFLQEKLKENFDLKKQSILFLNKRGQASSILCRDCGFTQKCRACFVAMTYHKKEGKHDFLLCHHCGLTMEIPARCPICSSIRIKQLGIGTQKVEEEIKKLLPAAKIFRADKDTITQKESYNRLYADLKNHNIDILIGTQMIAKGLDLPKVNLVGIILAEIGLNLPDFRSEEKTFQLLTQVGGRTGRGSERGEVIIQTYNPENFAINCAREHNYEKFFTYEIDNREKLKYPPFSQIIKLNYSHKDENIVQKETEKMKNLLTEKSKNSPQIQILSGPALIYKKQNKFNRNIIIKGTDLHKILTNMDFKNWKIDVDPINTTA